MYEIKVIGPRNKILQRMTYDCYDTAMQVLDQLETGADRHHRVEFTDLTVWGRGRAA